MVDERDRDGGQVRRERTLESAGESAGHDGRPIPPPSSTLTTTLLQDRIRMLPALLAVIETIEADVPAPYRIEVFRALVVGTSPPPGLDAMARSSAPELPSRKARAAQIPARQRVDLSHYAGILAAPGRTLLKALVALDATTSQLGVDWMSPSEIERFLIDRARVPHVYRTNISNALRGARPLADRRRRGRGYEYRITLTGREALQREQKILGD